MCILVFFMKVERFVGIISSGTFLPISFPSSHAHALHYEETGTLGAPQVIVHFLHLLFFLFFNWENLRFVDHFLLPAQMLSPSKIFILVTPFKSRIFKGLFLINFNLLIYILYLVRNHSITLCFRLDFLYFLDHIKIPNLNYFSSNFNFWTSSRTVSNDYSSFCEWYIYLCVCMAPNPW